MKRVDYTPLDQAGWEKVGADLCNEPTKTWLNIGTWLNAGDRFFATSDGTDEQLLLNVAGDIVTAGASGFYGDKSLWTNLLSVKL